MNHSIFVSWPRRSSNHPLPSALRFLATSACAWVTLGKRPTRKIDCACATPNAAQKRAKQTRILMRRIVPGLNKRARNSRRALRDLDPLAVDTLNSRNLRVTHRLPLHNLRKRRIIHQLCDHVPGLEHDPPETADRLLRAAFVIAHRDAGERCEIAVEMTYHLAHSD